MSKTIKGTCTYVPTVELEENPNAIYVQKASDEDDQALRISIMEVGVITPIDVVKKESKYFIINGHRRFSIGKELGLVELPVNIIKCESSAEEVMYMIASNTQRRKCYADILSEFRAYQKFYPLAIGRRNDLKSSEYLTSSEIAERIGVSYKTLQRLIYIQEHQPVLFKMVNDNELSPSAAEVTCRALKRLNSEKLDDEVLLKVKLIEIGNSGLMEAISLDQSDLDKSFKTALRVISKGGKPFHIKPVEIHGGKPTSYSNELVNLRQVPHYTPKANEKLRDTEEGSLDVHSVPKVVDIINQDTENISSEATEIICCGNPSCKYFGQKVKTIKKGEGHDII